MARRKPAWPDVPDHWHIGVDGRIGEARDPRFAGDTNNEYDLPGHLVIVLEGDFEVEEPTGLQFRSLWRLSGHLFFRHGIDASRAAGHPDPARTDCPDKNLIGEVRKFAKRIDPRRRSLVGDP